MRATLPVLALAGGTALEVTVSGDVVVTREDEQREVFALAGDAPWPGAVVACASRSGRSALVGLVAGDRLFFVDARNPGPQRRALGERIPNAEQLAFVAVSGGFVVTYENGLLFVDEVDGQERWCVDRVTFDWRFVDERENAVWLADADGNLLGFELATGYERA